MIYSQGLSNRVLNRVFERPSQNNLTYQQILRYFRDRAESALPHNENSTISRLGVWLVGLLKDPDITECKVK